MTSGSTGYINQTGYESDETARTFIGGRAVQAMNVVHYHDTESKDCTTFALLKHAVGQGSSTYFLN